jgi:uncharacterized protein involved in response to NO
MTDGTDENAISRRGALPIWGSAIFTLAFRPFFLAAGIWSAFSVALWILILIFGLALPNRFDPLSWHIHEMLFGYVAAAIGGFLLTAVPNWTGRKPLQGVPLACLIGLWLVGRTLCLFGSFAPLWLAAGLDIAFPAALCIVIARDIVAARSWRNLLLPMPVGLLCVADLLMFLERGGANVPQGLGWRLALSTIVILISVIGTKIIPTFTRNWLLARGDDKPFAGHGLLDRAALGALHIGLIGWALAPTAALFGITLMLASLLNLARLARWKGYLTRRATLLLVLHVGYLWLVIGAALLGASVLATWIPLAAGIHAFTAGAMGTMILAVMTRVSLAHTGRPLAADKLTSLLYLTVNLSAGMRIAAAFLGGSLQLQLLVLSAILWIASFAMFVGRYAPMLTAAGEYAQAS